MTSRRSANTLHARIIRDIRQKIVDGHWAPGYQLAVETDLANSYGVSRMTMNKALTQLSSEGYLVRRKRSGTFVAQPRAQTAIMAINDISEEVAALGLEYGWQLKRRELRKLDDADCRLLDVPGAGVEGEVLYLHGIHLANEEPFCLETRIIDVKVVPDALSQDFASIVPGQWLLHTIPWSTASHKIRAVNIIGQDAKALELPVGAACLEILRKTEIHHHWVTRVRLVYPGEAHQLVANFEPRSIRA
jgi:GntR family transcriptional regulator, histidine utilization repressor